MKRALQVIAVILLSLACSFADPTTIVAIATAVGEVSVNGNPLASSSAIFEGDRVVTGSSAALILHLSGSSVHLGPSSQALYRATALELLSGTTEIRGREPVVSGAFTIAPVRESNFSVQRIGPRTSLHLLSGTLKLSRRKQTTTIADPGDYTVADNDPLPIAKSGATTHVLPIAAGAAAGSSVAISHWLTGKEASTATSCMSGKSPTSCK